jgi:WD40 repeat protein
MFALVDSDNKVYIYDNKDRCDSYKPKLRVLTSLHKATIHSLDFSNDSYFVQTSSADYEHIRFNTDDGEIMNLPSQLKDIEWDTYTCHFGWSVQGLWPNISELQSKSKSTLQPLPEPTCVNRSPDHKLLAVGFSNGEVRLYQYPCISYGSNSNSNQSNSQSQYYRVEKLHVGPVSKCSFNHNSSLLVTLGKMENEIFIWKLD